MCASVFWVDFVVTLYDVSISLWEKLVQAGAIFHAPQAFWRVICFGPAKSAGHPQPRCDPPFGLMGSAAAAARSFTEAGGAKDDGQMVD